MAGTNDRLHESVADGVAALLKVDQSSIAVAVAASGVKEQPYRGGWIELTLEVVAGESGMTGGVRKEQPMRPAG